MTPVQLSALLADLLALARETEWVELKRDNSRPEEIGEYISALANSASLLGRDVAYLVWGIEDETHKIVGTHFRPHKTRKGNEELESWLMHSLEPQIDFKIHEWNHEGHDLVLFEIPPATQVPVAFKGERYIRIGSYKKPLKSNPAKEQALWAALSRKPFSEGIAKGDLATDEAIALLDFTTFFDLLKLPLPADQRSILIRLADENLLVAQPGGRWDITQLGTILLAKNLNKFDRLGRKALRIIRYLGTDRLKTEREWRDPPSQKGYAVSFDAAVSFIFSQLPQSEPIGPAFRYVVRMYPEEAIRELVANCLVHQDFAVTGAGPMVEIFADRVEITNPGEPLVDTMRFIDSAPRTRNEPLSAMMRRMKICEEAGTGVDKAVAAIEQERLPAPNFTVPPGSTRVFIHAQRKFGDMTVKDRLRACYQHACLCFVRNKRMTNASLRARFEVSEENSAQISRQIKEALNAGLIKIFDADARRKNASYLPFWA